MSALQNQFTPTSCCGTGSGSITEVKQRLAVNIYGEEFIYTTFQEKVAALEKTCHDLQESAYVEKPVPVRSSQLSNVEPAQ